MAKRKTNKTPQKQTKQKVEEEETVVPPSDDDQVEDHEEMMEIVAAGAEEESEEPPPSPIDEQEIVTAEETQFQSNNTYQNKQRCLVICTRGVTSRFRHLLEDLRTLLPHHRKDSKLDVAHGGMSDAVNTICDIKSCNTFMVMECRKRQDAYLWVGMAQTGPSIKFHVSNVHTMDELKLTGNCMKGSRPILTFDDSFDQLDELKLVKDLFVDLFGTPRGHPKSKPFVDRVMGFYYLDNKIWVRNYQILDEDPSNSKELAEAKKNIGANTSLIEIGPRFVLDPIRIFAGSLGGQTLFQNKHFMSPNLIRAMNNKDKGNAYESRKISQRNRKMRKDRNVLPEDPLADVFKE